MAYETGTATGWLDLLDKLVIFLTTSTDLQPPVTTSDERWTLLKQEDVPYYSMGNGVSNPSTPSELPGSPGNVYRDVYLRGPGLSGTDEIYTQIRAYSRQSVDLYNWMMTGSTNFDTNAAWELQPGFGKRGTSYVNYYTLSSGTIDYHFIANGRRWMIIAQIGSFP